MGCLKNRVGLVLLDSSVWNLQAQGKLDSTFFILVLSTIASVASLTMKEMRASSDSYCQTKLLNHVSSIIHFLADIS
jgi:hypothetical protein